ncbi:MAG: prolipoprotein diacylglyceryl transferase, partial [Proteobacteria bacterium]|nr:prolipoprotein diacylglyceryl transferase [Pseudomonadota bacterium]
MIAVITFPEIDPVLISIGPFAIRWYALAYIGGLVIAWRYCRWLAVRPPQSVSADAFDDFLLWATLGILLGGRLGYVLFYKPDFYLANPLEILFIWRGGMSFHGGLLGMVAAEVMFARRRGLPVLALADIVAAASPIGLFLGRIANFINGELFGRPSEVPWAMVFPHGGPQPRHPSQLYEAAVEGLVLLLVLHLMVRAGALERRGMLAGAFLIGYALARMLAEMFREPDAYLGFL